jgi:hypothetical protein
MHIYFTETRLFGRHFEKSDLNKSMQDPQINTQNDKINAFVKKSELSKRNTECNISGMFPIFEMSSYQRNGSYQETFQGALQKKFQRILKTSMLQNVNGLGTHLAVTSSPN